MHKILKDPLNLWKLFLIESEKEIQLSIKEILDKLKNINNVYAVHFEFDWYSFNIDFFAIDQDHIVLSENINILKEKIKRNKYFFKGLFHKEIEENEIYDGVEKIFTNWFSLCWNKVKDDYEIIPEKHLYYVKGKRRDIIKL